MLDDDFGLAAAHPAAQAAGATAAAIRQADDLADMGRYLDAHALAESLAAQPDVSGRLVAARILGHLGARRRGMALIARTWRAHRSHDEAWTQFVRMQAYRRGPRRAWLLMRQRTPAPHANAAVQADWHSLQAFVLGSLRDFPSARSAFESARAAAPQEPWPLVEWAHVCELADRYDEALDCVHQALALRPGLRSATQALAHLHLLAGRQEEAQSVLQDAMLTSQSANIATQLFDLQFEHGQYEAAERTLDSCTRFLPMPDAEPAQWLSARRADVALRLGRIEAAAAHAQAAGGAYYEKLAQRLREEACVPQRVELAVGFVRQHYNTCAPATLAALSSYWGRPAGHLAIAEEICYDGTPHHNERRWAEEQGFLAREFTADWPTTRALLDAGVPFTLTTMFTGSGHLQAAVGYDALRGCLLIRDPFRPTHNEFDAHALFESLRSSGPRGMVLLPPQEAGRLAHIELPDTPLWDDYHRAMRALSHHDRAQALQALDSLRGQAPQHRLTLGVERALASYDSDETGLLAATDKLLLLYPTDANLLLGKAMSLQQTGSRDEQSEWWHTVMQRVGDDATVLVRHAQFLADDGRLAEAAGSLLERALRLAPADATGWYALAGNLWQRQEREQGLAHYRIAACLAETNEAYADTYCRAAHAMRRTEEGLAFLHERTARLGGRSGAPAATLFQQLDLLERSAEAFGVLDAALQRRPQDADLLLFGVEAHLRYGQLDAAQALLERARPLARYGSWLRLNARLQSERGDALAALAQAEEAAVLEPLQLASHRLVATLLAQARGRAAAVEHLRAVAQRHPYHVELAQVLLEHIGGDAPQERADVLQGLVQRHPHNVWVVRELAVELARLRRFTEARAQAQAALALAPRSSSTHSTLAFVLLREDLRDDARAHLETAIRLSVDNDYAVSTLLALESELQARRAALGFVRDELMRQVTLGDGLLSFAEAAQSTLEPDDLLGLLRHAHQERPDLWHSWVATGMQLTRMGRYDEALELLAQARARFALQPRIPVEQAHALMLAGRREEARGFLLQALRISPHWTRPVRMYAEIVMDEGEGWQRALDVLDAALRRVGSDADLTALRGWILWRSGDAPAAREQMLAALTLEPGLRWAWEATQRIVQGPAAAQLLAQTAEQIVQQRPGQAVAWLRLAEYAADPARALGAAEQALVLEPRMQSAHEARLRLLMRQRRHDEVLSALDAMPWSPPLPSGLEVFRARVARERGDPDGAIAKMRALLERDPNDYALWHELSDWYDQQQRQAEYLEAARHLVRLAPHHHIAHGYLGDALLRGAQPDQALQAFERAFELDPSYAFAGLNLVDLLLPAKRLEDAARVLAAVARQDRGVPVVWRELQLAVARKDREQAIERFCAFVADNELAESLADKAMDLLRDAGWNRDLLAAVRRTFAAGPCARKAVRAWIRDQGQGWLPGAFYRDIRRALREDPAHALKQAFLEELATKREHRALLMRFLREWRDALRADTTSWSLAGYALLSQDHMDQTCSWMEDWRQRPDAAWWALDNLAFALRKCGRAEEARAVSQRSLELEPSNADALVWLAADAAHAGRHDELASRLEPLDVSALRPYYRELAQWLQAYLAAVRARDSSLAIAQMRLAHRRKRGDAPTRTMLPVLRARLLRDCTPPRLRLVRWFTLRY